MRVSQLRQHIETALADAKALDLTTLDVRKVASFTDYMMIATGTSTRHVVSVADKVVDRLREHGRRPVGLEGKDGGDWVLIDYGDVVVHVMRAPIRDFYQIEKLWSEGKRL